MLQNKRHIRKWERHVLRLGLFSQELKRFRMKFTQLSKDKVKRMNYIMERINKLWPD